MDIPVIQIVDNRGLLVISHHKVLKIQNNNCTINYAEINSDEKLDLALEKLHTECENNPKDYKLKELHDYTMILPKKYWGPGSYDKWIRVGWALRNTDFKLYITWLKFSSKSKDFKWSESLNFWKMWLEFGVQNEDVLTDKSIYFWARQDALAQYEEKKKKHMNEEPEAWTPFLLISRLFWLELHFKCAHLKIGLYQLG